MNQEIQNAVTEALKPIQAQLETIQGVLNILLTAAVKPENKSEDDLKKILMKMMSGAMPASVKESQGILTGIKATLQELGVQDVCFDGNKPWFQLALPTGMKVSVKKQENDFRLRLRDQGGMMIKESTSSMNGLAGAIKAIVA